LASVLRCLGGGVVGSCRNVLDRNTGRMQKTTGCLKQMQHFDLFTFTLHVISPATLPKTSAHALVAASDALPRSPRPCVCLCMFVHTFFGVYVCLCIVAWSSPGSIDELNAAIGLACEACLRAGNVGVRILTCANPSFWHAYPPFSFLPHIFSRCPSPSTYALHDRSRGVLQAAARFDPPLRLPLPFNPPCIRPIRPLI